MTLLGAPIFQRRAQSSTCPVQAVAPAVNLAGGQRALFRSRLCKWLKGPGSELDLALVQSSACSVGRPGLGPSARYAPPEPSRTRPSGRSALQISPATRDQPHATPRTRPDRFTTPRRVDMGRSDFGSTAMVKLCARCVVIKVMSQGRADALPLTSFQWDPAGEASRSIFSRRGAPSVKRTATSPAPALPIPAG